jgi:TM2 domain-containing membrane protein YozV
MRRGYQTCGLGATQQNIFVRCIPAPILAKIAAAMFRHVAGLGRDDTMRGQVLGVDARSGHGLVSGDDGQRYTFLPEDWTQRGEPVIGQSVDFETSGGRALNIFPLAAPPVPTPVAPHGRAGGDRNKYVAAALAFVLGTLGVHRFYLGRTGSGIVMLVLTITVVGLLITGLWALIDTFRYLVMSDAEFDARYQRRD